MKNASRWLILFLGAAGDWLEKGRGLEGVLSLISILPQRTCCLFFMPYDPIMTAITAKFPVDPAIKEGDRVTLDAVLTDGGLLITRMVRRDSLRDRKQAVAHFLKRWSGAGQPLTDGEIFAARTARLLEKHVK
jgi:hypothetical protein